MKHYRKHPHRPNGPRPTGPTRTGETVEGVIQMKGRSGFVLSEKENVPDTLVQGFSLKLARDGDRVLVKNGRIVSVVKRARKTAVGILQRENDALYLVPEAEDFRVKIQDLGGLTPQEGHFAVAEITRWPASPAGGPTGAGDAQGILREVLGPAAKPGVDLKTVIRKFELPDAFPPAVQAAADAFPEVVLESDLHGRHMFLTNVVTIDGEDAQDFDDAVSLHPPKENQGWRLGVHIADVSHYVQEGSPLDQEALSRGTSVYFPGHVVPMLPTSLSNNLCSLRPDVERLTLSCLMDISVEGEVTGCEIRESAIKSARRFTYSEVEALLKGENVERVSPKLLADVKEMDRLARTLRRKRMERGSLDFDFPEPDVTLDAQGRPIDIQKKDRLESHRLIEDFMLLANESVARFMSSGPFLYRIHELPDKMKLEKLGLTLRALGLNPPAGTALNQPKALQKIIALADGKPIEPIVQMMILRSLKQAVYSPSNRGHFGLASTCYTHFTSPIRRYPDLIVHRLVRERLRHENAARKTHWSTVLEKIALHSSQRERVAVEAEREFRNLQKVRFMTERVGETFAGVITGIAGFGFFVELEQMFVEGMVPLSSLDDFYVYDEVRMRLIGKRTGRIHYFGQKVQVKLVMANAVKRQLEFQLLSAEGHSTRGHTGKPPRHQPGRHGHHGKRGRHRGN